MTNKEAIEELKKVDTLDMPARLCEAHYMAIKALEQEPTDDATLKDIFCMGCEYKEQEPSGDAISRQAVQDYIAKYLSQYLYNDVREAVETIDEYVGELPSVTQKSETVTEFADRCRECGARYGKLLKQEPKTGHWIADEFGNKCSCCGIHIDKYMKFNYCPNCGCRMVEPQKSEE